MSKPKLHTAAQADRNQRAVADSSARHVPKSGEYSSETTRKVFRCNSFELIWLICVFLLFSGLAFLFTPNGDDWAWGSSIGIDRLNSFFADYNGRYLANLLVLALTRAPFAAPFIVGATLAAIVFLILDLSKNRTAWGYAVTTALILAMPETLWRQTISWMSGFTNYTISTLLVLVFARAAQADWQGCLSTSHRKLRFFATIVLAFFSALFMENVTIFFVVASLSLLIVQKIVLRRTSAVAWAWTAGFTIGAAVMFSNEAYLRAFGGDGYQQVTGFKESIGKIFDLISRFAVIDNLALSVALASAVILLGLIFAHRNGAKWMIAPLILSTLFVVVAVALHQAESALIVPDRWRYLAGAGALFLLASLFSIGPALCRDRKNQLYCATVATLLILAPLAIVNPIGPRLFLVTYMFMLIILNIVLREVASLVGDHALSAVGVLAAALSVGLLSTYFVFFTANSIAATDRLNHIREQVAAGAETVKISRLPFTAYVHVPDPTDGLWEKRYKLYYQLPQELDITLSN